MRDDIRCDNCGQVCEEHNLAPIHDYWGRVEPGGVVPLGQCPDAHCRALCYPPYGYVYDLEQQRATLQDTVSRLLDWAATMGGWDAPVWARARRVLARSAAQVRDATPGTPGRSYTLQATTHWWHPQTWDTLRTRAPLDEIHAVMTILRTEVTHGYVRYRIFRGQKMPPAP